VGVLMSIRQHQILIECTAELASVCTTLIHSVLLALSCAVSGDSAPDLIMHHLLLDAGSSQQGTGDDGSSGSGLSGAQLLRGGPGVSRSYLLVQRPEGGLLAGLWEFPGESSGS
jgi:hypothetical protein